ALFGPPGLAAGIFYLVHNVLVKGSLFLSAGAVEHAYGTGRLDRLEGLVRTEGLVAVAFVAAAFSLSGLPPFSGFVGKLLLVGAAVEGGHFVVAGVIVALSLVTLIAMMKIWNSAFWGPAEEEPEY